MTVREGILTQVSWREGAVVKKGLAGLLRAGLEPGTRGAKKELICLPEREGWKRRRRAHGSDSHEHFSPTENPAEALGQCFWSVGLGLMSITSRRVPVLWSCTEQTEGGACRKHPKAGTTTGQVRGLHQKRQAG